MNMATMTSTAAAATTTSAMDMDMDVGTCKVGSVSHFSCSFPGVWIAILDCGLGTYSGGR